MQVRSGVRLSECGLQCQGNQGDEENGDEERKEGYKFQKMDLRDLGEFENERFGTILDKACLDAVRFVLPHTETTLITH